MVNDSFCKIAPIFSSGVTGTSQNNKNNICKNAGHDIIGHNTVATLQLFCLFYRKRLHNVKNPEKHKTDGRDSKGNFLPCHGNTDTRKLINDNIAGVFSVILVKVDGQYGKENKTDTKKDVAENRREKINKETSERRCICARGAGEIAQITTGCNALEGCY